MSESVVSPSPNYRFGNFVLDTKQKLLFKNEEVVPLNQKSFDCLLLLVQNAGKVVLKEDFFNEIWGDSFVEDGVLAVNISNLRKILEAGQNQKFIETLSRRGYRFLVNVAVESAEFNKISSLNDEFTDEFKKNSEKFRDSQPEFHSQDVGEILKKEIPENRFAFSKIHYFGLAILAVCIITASYFFYLKYKQNNSNAVNKISLAIFPMENVSGNTDLDYLSLSMADSLNYSFSSLPHISVAPTSAIKRYVKQNYIAVDEGKKLNADQIVTGSYRIEGNKVIFAIQLQDLNNSLVRNQTFEAPLNDFTGLRTTIFKFLVQSLNLNKTDYELAVIQKQESQNPLAYEYYLKGSTAYFNAQLDSSINYFQKAIELDPNFLFALEGLATSYLQKGSVGGCGAVCYQKSLEIREKIVKIAPEYERGLLNLALLYVDSNQIEKAMPIIKGVLEKNKESKHGLFVLSYAYRYAGMVDESIKITEESQSLEASDRTSSNPVTSYIYAQKYDKFLQSFHTSPNNPYGLFYKGFAYYYLKNYAEANTAFDSANNISSDLITSKIGKVYSLHINKNDEAALKLLNEIKDGILKNQVNDGEMIYKIAQAYAELKQTKDALEMFNLSVEKGFFCFPYFKNDPLIDNIRNNPEFERIFVKSQKRHDDFRNNFVK